MKDFVKHVAEKLAVEEPIARAAIGVVLNAADRQGSPLAEAVFRRVPGARTLSAVAGDAVGAATGLIARMIEQTPGGRGQVAFQLIADLQRVGLGHQQISDLPGAMAGYVEDKFGFKVSGHLGDLLGAGNADVAEGSDTNVA